MNKERIVVVCPGRGSYTRETSNYLRIYGNNLIKDIKWMDFERESHGRESLTKLDSQKFKSNIHMLGENASSLIYACSLSDFSYIDVNKYEIISVLGNSMGWYTSLVLSGAISKKNGFHLIEKMGSMMKREIIGGQLIYPIINENWEIDNKLYDFVLSEVKRFGLHISIKLGGYMVIGGKRNKLKNLSKVLPINEKYREINRVKSLLKNIPFPYKKILPEEKYLANKNNPPNVEVHFFDNIINLENINCYSNEQNKWRKSKLFFTKKNQ